MSILVLEVYGGAQGSAFPISSQVVPLTLV